MRTGEGNPGVAPSQHNLGSLLQFLAKADEPGASVNLMDIALYATSPPWFIE